MLTNYEMNVKIINKTMEDAMKEFDNNKFCNDLIALRGKESQSVFAEKLGVKRSTLSLLENGKQIPTIDILRRICDLSGKSTEEYFITSKTDALVYLMGTLEESDKVKIEEMAERIRIKEKYELLSKRGSYVID
jgi:transcriptional regulator with XRE-family HTH domain